MNEFEKDSGRGKMQNEQWNFDISEMTISSESSCSLSTTIGGLPAVSVEQQLENKLRKERELLQSVSYESCDSVQNIIITPLEKGETSDISESASKCDQISDGVKDTPKIGEKDEEEKNELVLLPGGKIEVEV